MPVIEDKDSVVTPLRAIIEQTFAIRNGRQGHVLFQLGMFANVIDLGQNRGVAVSADGVGTKLLIAQIMQKFDTIGIDCIAMNVNDVLCMGAEPLAVIIYVIVERPITKDIANEIGVGIYKGAELADVTIPQIKLEVSPEIVHGADKGTGFEIEGKCVGMVAVSKIITGDRITPGDVVIGLSSGGLHSNGYTTARTVFFDCAKWKLSRYIAEFGRSLGEELLEPTRIYVKPVLAMLEANIDIKFMAHITGGGLINLRRCVAEVGFIIEHWPEIPAVFRLIQELGGLPDTQMFHDFNMGIGFCVVVAPEAVDQVRLIAGEHGIENFILGQAVSDPERKIVFPPRCLISRGTEFVPTP